MNAPATKPRTFVFRSGDVEAVLDVADCVERLRSAGERNPGERGQLEAAREILIDGGFERISRADCERLLEAISESLAG